MQRASLRWALRQPQVVQVRARHLAVDRWSDWVERVDRERTPPRRALKLLFRVEDGREEGTGVALGGPLPALAVPAEAEATVGAALPELPCTAPRAARQDGSLEPLVVEHR